MEQGLYNPGPFTIFLVFTAGLLTSLGPCSLSLLPITIAYVGGTKNKRFKLQEEIHLQSVQPKHLSFHRFARTGCPHQ